MTDGPSERHPYRWVIFSGMAAVYFAFGMMVMSIPPMVATVRGDLGISRAAMGLALGAWPLIYIATAPPAGRLIDRMGLRWSILVGGCFVVVSGLARAGAQGLGSLWVAIAIFGIGGPLVSASAPKMIAVWFGQAAERRLAVGLYTAAPALGGIVALLLTNSVLLPLTGSWRGVVIIESVVATLAVGYWAVVSSKAPPPPAPAVRTATGDASWRSLLASPGVRLALVLGLGSFFVNHGLNGWLPNVLEEESGLSASTASTWVAASTVVGIGASLTLPRLAGGDRRARMLQTVMALMALSLVVIVVAPSAGDVVATLGLGVRSALVPLVVLCLMEAEGVTAENMGTANGLWFSVAEIGGASGPLVVGAVGDTGAGFGGSLLVLTGVLFVLIAVVALDLRRSGNARAPSTPTSSVS